MEDNHSVKTMSYKKPYISYGHPVLMRMHINVHTHTLLPHLAPSEFQMGFLVSERGLLLFPLFLADWVSS